MVTFEQALAAARAHQNAAVRRIADGVRIELPPGDPIPPNELGQFFGALAQTLDPQPTRRR
jgi:hypothetical protein